MGIQAGIAVVAHHQEVIGGHRDRSHRVIHGLSGPIGFGPFPIAHELSVFDFQGVSRPAHNPFDQGCLGVVSGLHQDGRGAKNHHGADFQRQLQLGFYLLHQDPVLHLKGGQHGS